MKFAKCLENRRFPCYNNTNAKSVPSGAQANRTGSGRAYMNCAEIRRLPWLIRLLTSVLLAALVLTPAPLARSAWRTRLWSTLLPVSIAAPARAFAPPVLFSRNKLIKHSRAVERLHGFFVCGCAGTHFYSIAPLCKWAVAAKRPERSRPFPTNHP